MLLRCCLIHRNIIITRKFLYLLYFCPCLDLGLFMSYLYDLLFIFIFIAILTNRIISHCVKSVQIRSIFWSVFSDIWIEYWDLRSKSPHSVRMQENTDQKKLRIWTLFTHCHQYRHTCSFAYFVECVLFFLDDNLDEEWELFWKSKNSASRCCLAFTGYFVNLSLALLIKVLLIKKACKQEVSSQRLRAFFTSVKLLIWA